MISEYIWKIMFLNKPETGVQSQVELYQRL